MMSTEWRVVIFFDEILPHLRPLPQADRRQVQHKINTKLTNSQLDSISILDLKPSSQELYSRLYQILTT